MDKLQPAHFTILWNNHLAFLDKVVLQGKYKAGTARQKSLLGWRILNIACLLVIVHQNNMFWKKVNRFLLATADLMVDRDDDFCFTKIQNFLLYYIWVKNQTVNYGTVWGVTVWNHLRFTQDGRFKWWFQNETLIITRICLNKQVITCLLKWVRDANYLLILKRRLTLSID